MKQSRFWILSMFFMFLLIAGCGKDKEASPEVLTGPPDLMVICGDKSVKASCGTYSWMYKLRNGEMQGIEADARHPLDCQDTLEVLEVSGDKVSLQFDVMPDSIASVSCWSDAHWGDMSSESETVTADGFEIELKKGGYIYEVVAKWAGNGSYNGTAHYSFYIKTAE